jgi:anti-sigma factor RsiW
MTDADRPITEEDILRYVDGDIDPKRREDVERHLQSSAADANTVTAYRHQNRLLREAFDSILEERVPEALVATAMSSARPRFARPIWAAVAALLLFVAGLGTGWYAADLGDQKVAMATSGDFKAYAMAAYRVYTPEVRHAVEVGAADEDHLIQWLSKRLGHPVKAPALSPLGFELVGGRLLAAPDGQPAAQFMYQDRTMRRVTLYVRGANASEPTSFRFARDNDCAMFYWVDAPFAYALVGSMDKDELHKISASVYDQLSN